MARFKCSVRSDPKSTEEGAVYLCDLKGFDP